MKRIENKQKYLDLINALVTSDIASNKSVIKTVLFNKMITFLYEKLAVDQKKQMVEMLRSGITNEFLAFMENNLSNEDQMEIAEMVTLEITEIYNSTLIAQTNVGFMAQRASGRARSRN